MNVGSASQIRNEPFDFVVIGSGLAGLTYALHASEHGSVAVLTKAEMRESSTNYAQGGIAAAVGEADSWQLHEQDTMAAGAWESDPEAVRFLVKQAPAAIEWLTALGARFDEEGAVLDLGREGGHSRHRIVHHSDKTGWEVERAVSEAARKNGRITVFENSLALQLLHTEGGRCAGVLALLEDSGPTAFSSRAVMIATGGCGQLYTHTTNPPVATGDGIAIAMEAGASVRDLEFMQFHPTTLYHPALRSFLISEAVRGAGATLRNHLGERFMYDYDKSLELAPRDIVARAVEAEMKRLGTECVYLDLAHLPARTIKSEFPTINKRLESIGLEIHKQWIPVVPAQHYTCGGIRTDLDGRSSLSGLYAAGEVASSGVHGANRLASNSLLECIVFGAAAAKASAQEPSPTERAVIAGCPTAIDLDDSQRIRSEMQRVMSDNVGIVRTDKGLASAKESINALMTEYESLPDAPLSRHPIETRNLLVVAEEVVSAAHARRSNLGLHYNADLA